MSLHPAIRLAVLIVVAASLTGCRLFRRNHEICEPCCTTCGMESTYDDGMIMGEMPMAEPGCTVCGKANGVVDGMLIGPEFGELTLPQEHEAYSLQPVPDEQPIQADNSPEPVKEVEVAKPQETVEPVPMPTPPTAARPAGLNLDVRSSLAVAMQGQEVTFDISIENSGQSAIEGVDMTAVFSEGLQPKSISPAGVAKIEGSRVVFEEIKSFAPMKMTYRIVATTQPGSAEGKMTVRVESPMLLTSGPLTQDAVVRITP